MASRIPNRNEEGIGLVDVMVAAVLFLLVVAAVGYVIQQSSIAVAAARERSNASAAANNELSMFISLSCGLETGVDTTASTPAATAATEPGAPSAATLAQRCKQANGTEPVLGDPTPGFSVSNGGYKYTVTVGTDWALRATTGTSTANLCPSSTYTPPMGAFRNIRIHWTPHASGVPESFPGTGPLTTFAATPPDALLYHNTSDGGIVFTGMAAGSKIVLAVPGFSSIQRAVNAKGCAWFPFLPPKGGYSAKYYAPATTTSPTSLTTLTVTTGENLEQPA